MTKDELRAIYKTKRLALKPEEALVLDLKILEGLKKLDFSSISYLQVYLPIAKWNEYDTSPFIGWLRQQHSTINIVVSISDLEQGTLQHFIWNTESVEENAWGIPELILRKDTVPVAPTDLDLILMPLLVCDRHGNRVGYGKGFYDRFLQNCRPDVQKVGISYFQPLTTSIIADPWDVPLDCVITPEGLVSF